MKEINNMYNMGTVLELDDGKNYVIASNVKSNDKDYLYLVDLNNETNVMFCEIQEQGLAFVSEKNLLQKLILMVHLDVTSEQ